MRRRSLLTFVVLNVLISIGVALAVISALGPQNPTTSQVVITVPILVTATTDPNATERVRIVTATPLPGTPQSAAFPTDILNENLTANALPTFDSAILAEDVALQGTATALPNNCILHTIKEGEFPSSIAFDYDVDMFLLMEVNDLTEETASLLQIGQTLIVPLEGCTLVDAVTDEDVADEGEDTEDDEAGLSAVDEETEEVATSTPRPTLRPTVTIAPTAVNARVQIRDVTDAGDVTAEGVEIENTGDTVNIAGWTLIDQDSNTFTFPEQFLFSNARVTVYTREGQNTAIAFFWGQDQPVWQSGDVVTLQNAAGEVQSTYQIP